MERRMQVEKEREEKAMETRGGVRYHPMMAHCEWIMKWIRADAGLRVDEGGCPFHMEMESIQIWMNELCQRLNRRMAVALWPKLCDMSD
jgi:hypothetical protein